MKLTTPNPNPNPNTANPNTASGKRKIISAILPKGLLTVILILGLSVIIFTSAGYSQSGWFSQPLPVNGQVQDLKFFDANTGLIAMWQPTVLLRTTNGGYNWNIVLSNQAVGDFEIIDSSTVYARGTGYTSFVFLYRSFNKGLTWDSLPVPGAVTIQGISFINRDTGWVGGSSNGEPYLWKTTNGGINWTVNSTVTGRGKIFFLKYKVNGEYIGWSMDFDSMFKTTNSGVSWIEVQQSFGISEMYYIDENVGYVTSVDLVKKTTNGGINWNSYSLPFGNYIIGRSIARLEILNRDTIYGDNGFRQFPNGQLRGVIWISTNGGVNWGFQQPDTSIKKLYQCIDFVNKDTGWSVWIRTNDGGGPIIIPTYIPNSNEELADDYKLNQNYPNPFNSSTTIEIVVPEKSYLSLKIIDLTGKTVFWVLYNDYINSGTHKFTINGFGKLNLASGVYFCRLEVKDKISYNTNRTLSRKMIYLK